DLLAAAVPEGRVPIRNLMRQFVLQRFSPHRTSETSFDPLNEWQALRPLLLRQSISHWLQSRRERRRRAKVILTQKRMKG
ncbi:MAG: hypothetical protein AB1791_16715, partial [Chloroflexota bacterium]